MTMMSYHCKKWSVAVLLAMLLCALVSEIAGQELYDRLGVAPSASDREIKRAYRQLSLKFHPDKQTGETREKMKEEFVKIANAYRVLSDPERRHKYDLYGVVDDHDYKNFDEAFRHRQDGFEDSWTNWLGLFGVLAAGVVPIVIMYKNRAKPSKRRREARLGLLRSKLVSASSEDPKQFVAQRKKYLKDPQKALDKLE